MDKAAQTVEIMGYKLPKYQDCTKCGAKLACVFAAFTYSQPCDNCKNTPEYEAELAKSKEEKAKVKHINDALKANIPLAVHEFKGRYLYTNHRGDIIKDEKMRPMKRGEKFKK